MTDPFSMNGQKIAVADILDIEEFKPMTMAELRAAGIAQGWYKRKK